MASKDLYNNTKLVRAISPVVATNNDALVSQVIDTVGYESLTFAILTGTLADTDATFTVLVEDGDTSGSLSAVSDDFLLGTEAGASFTFAADDSTREIGYAGKKRYVRITITPAGNSGNAAIAVGAILGHPHVAPAA